MVSEESRTYFGLDFSTQQLKGIIVDDKLNAILEEVVPFDSSMPEFRTHKGCNQSKDGKTITSPTIMFVKALDILMNKLQASGADFSKVAAICGTGQQHGTVYWQKGSVEAMKSLDPTCFLYTQLATCFTISNSPIWMDSSTTAYCKKLEEAVGGSKELARITGSIAYERFSGPQIAKIADTKKTAYDNTERISLISSFGCSLFLGDYAPIDLSDGSGMNLLDIRTKLWNKICLQACAPNLAEKLGTPVPSDADLGAISPYFVKRYTFNPKCRVVAFSGDNPSSLVGMRLNHGDITVSLGTSDTLFLWLDEPVLLPEGHIFVNPLNHNAFMVLLCFKNGSLVRERFRNEFANQSWDEFSQKLEKTPRGNFGYMGLFFDVQEIIPFVRGDFRYDAQNNPIKKFPTAENEIRALIEGQFIAKRAHAEELGYKIESEHKILVTGGGSRNTAIVQVLSDVFNSPVYEIEGTNSAALGSAFMAKQGIRDKSVHKDPDVYFKEITKFCPQYKIAAKPYSNADQIYTPMVDRYKTLIRTIASD